jgi:hypothetical protein
MSSGRSEKLEAPAVGVKLRRVCGFWRIIAVCDASDAMTSARPHRNASMSDQDAVAELRHSSGTQFAPAVVTVVTVVCALPPTARSGV